MNKKIIYILNSKTLYQIFDEIKNEFDFEIVFTKNMDYIKKNSKDDQNLGNAIILAFKNRISIKEIFFSNNSILLDDLPISLKNLLENINIVFLKSNFKVQSKFYINDYELNLNARTIIKKKISLKLTEKEIMIIVFLFKIQKPTSVSLLQSEVWKQKSNLETHTVETHIYRLRKKFSEVFNDNEFIKSNKVGYFIKY